MQIQITDMIRGETGFYVTATCNKTRATVSIHTHGVQVCCHNASNRAWGGFGKHFQTINDALQNYRSADMRAIIEAAADAYQIPASVTTH